MVQTINGTDSSTPMPPLCASNVRITNTVQSSCVFAILIFHKFFGVRCTHMIHVNLIAPLYSKFSLDGLSAYFIQRDFCCVLVSFSVSVSYL